MASLSIQCAVLQTVSLPSKPWRVVLQNLPHLILVPYVIWLEWNNHHCNSYRPSHLHSRKRESNPKTLEQSPLHFHSWLVWPETEGNKHAQSLASRSRDNQGDIDCPIAVQQKVSLPYILSSLLFMWPKQDNADERQKKTGWAVLWAAGSAPLNLYSLLHWALKSSLWEEGNLFLTARETGLSNSFDGPLQ